MSTHAQGEPEEPLKNAMHIKLMFIALKELCPPMHKLSKHCTLFTQVGAHTLTRAHAHTHARAQHANHSTHTHTHTHTQAHKHAHTLARAHTHGTAEWSAHDARFACRETARSARPTAAPAGS